MNSSFNKELAATIKHTRKMSGLTQSALAELAGISKTTVYDIEHGKGTVQLNTTLSVLKVLNIKLLVSAPFESKNNA